MPSKYVEGVYPIFIERGKGCHVWDNQDTPYIDYPNALGAILLGYSYPAVNEAIKDQLNYGTIFTFPSILEGVLAEKLTQIIPCAEMVQFLKTGSDATSAAVKVARAYTGKDHVAFCGYHGWHDWFTVNTPKNKGIPSEYVKYTHKFVFNDIKSLEKIFEEVNAGVGAVILEPCIWEEPKDGFLSKVKKLCQKHGAVLIFDEVVTGFRFPGFSAQKFFKVTPDLSAFGKAMANGMPISFVCGKKEIMEVLKGDCFISTTFGGELLSIVAALATIKVLETEPVFDKFWYLGNYLKDGYNEIAKELGLDTKCIGYPNRTMHTFPTAEHKGLFWQECVKRQVIFGYAQFINYSHNQADIDYTLDVVREALKVLKKNWKDPKKALEGNPPAEVFRLLVEKDK